MPKLYFKPALMTTNLLKSDFILTTLATLLILHIGIDSIPFVCSSTVTPYPDANARPTIASKLENYLTPSNITTTTTGYLNVYNANDSYGKSNIMHFIANKLQKQKIKIRAKFFFSMHINLVDKFD